MPRGQVVTLNVGGCTFSTTRSTVCQEPSSRLALLVRGLLPGVKDKYGQIFVDRDPRHFQTILNYLRDGWVVLPSSEAELQELLSEVRFYQLADMESWIRTQHMLGSRSNALLRPLSAGGSSVASPGSPRSAYGAPPRTSSSLELSAPLAPKYLDDSYRWTAKYLRSNSQMQQVADALEDLANVPRCSISSHPQYGRLGPRYLLAKVTSASGRSHEWTLDPYTEPSLYYKYNVTEYVHDNWFMLRAVLKEQYGILMEEDCTVAKSGSLLTKRANLHIVLRRL